MESVAGQYRDCYRADDNNDYCYCVLRIPRGGLI